MSFRCLVIHKVDLTHEFNTMNRVLVLQIEHNTLYFMSDESLDVSKPLNPTVDYDSDKNLLGVIHGKACYLRHYYK